jgi:hypothetical protein
VSRAVALSGFKTHKALVERFYRRGPKLGRLLVFDHEQWMILNDLEESFHTAYQEVLDHVKNYSDMWRQTVRSLKLYVNENESCDTGLLIVYVSTILLSLACRRCRSLRNLRDLEVHVQNPT